MYGGLYNATGSEGNHEGAGEGVPRCHDPRRMGEPPDYPEWAGYLAAFDAYLDAKKRGDDEHVRQARLIMRWFAAELLPADRTPEARRRVHGDLAGLLRALDLDGE